MSLSVLRRLPGNFELRACMRCGEVGYGEAVVDEPRPHDVQFLGYERIALSPELLEWLSAWPRLADRGHEQVWIGARERFENRAALDLATGEAPALNDRARLVATGVPTGPPPPGLPKPLQAFERVWEGLRFVDETPIETLMEAALEWNGPRALAYEVLARRTDLLELASQWRYSREERLRQWGQYLVREFHLESKLPAGW